MILLGATVLAGFVEGFVSSSLFLFPVLCNVSVYMNMNLICFSRIKKLLIERHRVHGLEPLTLALGSREAQQGAALS